MKLAISFAMCAACAFAQWGGFGRSGQTSIRANIHGGGSPDNGKCTIEVDVDGSAEVMVTGDTARIRTLSGAPSFFRRMDCNAPMPRNMADFRFRGIDGRGSQNLIRDPRQNGGTTVVRIDDPRGGREGYTFDLEWRGGGYYGNNGPYGNDPYGNGGYDPYGYPNDRRTGRDDGYYGRGNGGYGNGGYGNGGYGNGGYGNGNWGGWNNGWGDQVQYRGRGRGQLWAGNRAYRINGSDVYVDRSTGRVTVELDTDYGRDAMRFSGRIQRVEGDTIFADVRSAESGFGGGGANGVMRIRVRNGRRVDSIDMDGNGPGGRFRLNWSD